MVQEKERYDFSAAADFTDSGILAGVLCLSDDSGVRVLADQL